MKSNAILLFALGGLLAAPARPAAKPVVFHVAPDGSDARSGAARSSAFASLERARDAVRDLKRRQGGKLKTPVNIVVHGGTYTLARRLELGPEDSGAAECPVTWTSYKNETPVVSGGRAISGWKQAKVNGKDLWTVEIPAVKEGKWYFRQLFMNGERRQRARYPNEGFVRMTGVPDLDWDRSPYGNPQSRFQYAPGEIGNWENLQDAEVVILHFWVSTRRPIASVDEGTRTVKLSQPTSFRMTDGFGKKAELARYYVENAFELLDTPGEWYLNRKTGVLYYMPKPGETIARAQAVAPVLEQLVQVEGDPRADRYVEHVTFRGLTFEHAEWWLPADDPHARYQQQGSVYVGGAIRLYGARNVSFELCTVAHMSNYGIHYSRGCSYGHVTGCRFFDMGGGGIKVGEPDRSARVEPDANGIVHNLPSEETHHMELTDNDIYDGGRIFHQAHGIWVSQCYDNLISHNRIHDYYKNAVSVGWTWDFGKSLARNNIIEWNDVHHIGKGWFNDGGALYTLGVQPGTIVRYNLMHDIGSVVYGGRGVYLDQGSAQILVEKNISYNTTGGGFAHTYGKQNVVRNNIFTTGKVAQIEPYGGNVKGNENEFLFERNIVYWKGEQKMFNRPWNEKKVVLRRNLYWYEGGPAKFGGATWDEWRARGFDEGSLVADPLFVNPEKHDFRLKPGSPALQLGFEPFDLSAVGPRPAVLKKLREAAAR